MPPALFKLIAIFLLVVQGVVALASGRVLCIPVQYCVTHETDVPAALAHCGSNACTVAGGDREDRESERGLFVSSSHPDDQCGCHLHVPIPSDEQAPSKPKGDSPDLRTLFFPLVITISLIWVFTPRVQLAPPTQPPDFSTSDQVLALKTTRILI